MITESCAADLSAYNNTYKSLRIIGDGYDLYYSVWCNNEHELYDMNVSPRLLEIYSPELDVRTWVDRRTDC